MTTIQPPTQQPQWRSTFGLLFAFVILGTGAFWIVTSLKPKQDAKEEASKHVFSELSEQAVKSIEIKNGSSSILLSCLKDKECKTGKDGDWEVTERVVGKGSTYRADDTNVNALLSAL